MSRKKLLELLKGKRVEIIEIDKTSLKNKLFSILLAILVISHAITMRVDYGWSTQIYNYKMESINLNTDRAITKKWIEVLTLREKAHEVELWIHDFRYWQNTIQEKFIIYDHN